jgi:diguanylate cyclase (GGDEF)-like protein
MQGGPFKFAVALTAWTGYAMAVLALHPRLGGEAALLVFVPVILTAYWGGIGWGVAAGALSYLLNSLLLPPLWGEWWGMAVVLEQRGALEVIAALFLGPLIGYLRHLKAQLSNHREISYYAEHDALTGLLNRATFERKLELALTEAKEQGGMLALLFVDLDRFKFVNDTYGHKVGDELLVKIADHLKANVRQGDLVGRIGGDEFTVALRNLRSPQVASVVAKKLVRVLSAPQQVAGKTLHVSASIGIGVYPDDGSDIQTLTKSADSAMYQVKALGKNGCTFSTGELRAQESRKLELERHLRSALHGNEFELHYQPQVELATERVVGFEALVRWHSPVLGVVSPKEFIGLAEETGLIVPIGHWLLREVCYQLHTWQRAGLPSVKVSLNASPLQFVHPDFLVQLKQAVSDYHVEPQWLGIEITESLLLRDLPGTVKALQRLEALGIATALDDFGTGYSSFAYLSQLPIRYLKIDHSFVSRIMTAQAKCAGDAAVIVEAICALAHKLGKQVIAEGVETIEQRDYLKRVGCEYAQGYLYSRALPASEIERIMRRHVSRQPKLERLNTPSAGLAH